MSKIAHSTIYCSGRYNEVQHHSLQNGAMNNFLSNFVSCPKGHRKELIMKKALVAVVILFVISLFTAIVSFLVCGGELIKTGIDYGVEQYREYKSTGENDITDIIENI